MLDRTRKPKPTPIERALFARQRQLLLLLDALGGEVKNLDFQKLLFLYCQEVGTAPPYEFVPYKFGAFSFTSYADRRKLIERGYLIDDPQNWQLTDAGAQIVGKTADLQLSEFAKRHHALRGDALVADTYRRFPFHASRSEIAPRVLRGDRRSLARIDEARAPEGGKALNTIGYEGHSLESYLNVLLKAGITQLCDVRRNALSRKYGFSKSTLSNACVGVGIRYEHIPELGIASDKRQKLEAQADYDALFREYKRDWLPKKTIEIEKIVDWVREGQRVALTCYEHLSTQCHRGCLSKVLEKKMGKEKTARHL
jgi:hypothetical protein